MSTPLVSVVVPTCDREELLRFAVRSVLAQSEQNFELIIIDDASADGTAAYLQTLTALDSRVRIVRNAVRKGGAGARNEGVVRSAGKWIAFLDDDDEWLPAKLQQQLQTLHENAAAIACTCNYVLRTSSGSIRTRRVPSNITLQQLFLYNYLGGASMCLCSGDALREMGGFDAKFRSAQDHDLWIRLRQRGAVVSCNAALVVHRAHSGKRITTDMRLQHLGARRLYFKHRDLMDAAARRYRVAFSCYIMSRQPSRSLRHRARYLMLAVRNSSARVALAYALSSAPRLARDALRGSAGDRGAVRTY